MSDPVGRGAAETAATDAARLKAAITKALLDASWEGRWSPLDETNVAPLVHVTVPIVIDAVLAVVGSDTPTRTERVIEGYRWCPLLRDVYGWDEGHEQGCQWCDSDEPHQPLFRRVPSPHTDSSET